MAFDPEFDRDAFRRDHVFAAECAPRVIRVRTCGADGMEHAIAEAEKYVSEMPDEWLYLDSGRRSERILALVR